MRGVFLFYVNEFGPWAAHVQASSQHGKQLCAFAHFIPRLTYSLASKQAQANKAKQKKQMHKTAQQLSR